MKSSTLYILGGLAFNVFGGAAMAGVSSPGELALAASLLFVGSLLVTIGAIAKGVTLGLGEHDDELALAPPTPEIQRRFNAAK